jgi:hypothetical protein
MMCKYTDTHAGRMHRAFQTLRCTGGQTEPLSGNIEHAPDEDRMYGARTGGTSVANGINAKARETTTAKSHSRLARDGH